MVQYDSYGTIPQAVRDLIANKCKLLDQYILMQTGENEFTALIYDPVKKETTQYVFTRASNYGAYSVKASEGVWAFTVSNEYYTYSNVGYGSSLDLPVIEGVIAHSCVFMTCVLVFAILFRSVLFPWLKTK